MDSLIFAGFCVATVAGLCVFVVRQMRAEAAAWRAAVAESSAAGAATTDRALKELAGLCALPVAAQERQLAFAERKLSLDEKKAEDEREMKRAREAHMQNLNNLRNGGRGPRVLDPENS